MTDNLRVLIMAGGTGGHVFPALAVADQLRSADAKISWLGTRRGIESELVPSHGIEAGSIQFFDQTLGRSPIEITDADACALFA